MAELAELLNAAAGRRGVAHNIAIQQLRDWMKGQPEDRIIRDMRNIPNIDLLKYMQEAGLSGRVYNAYLSHLHSLGGDFF